MENIRVVANSITCWDLKADEYMEIGCWIQILWQMFNIREGIDSRKIKLRIRLLGVPPQTAGPNKGVTYDLEKLKKIIGRKLAGIPRRHPTTETIAALDLSD